MSRLGIALLSLSPLAVVASCSPNTSGSTLAVCRPLTHAPAVVRPGWEGTVFTVVMENKSRGEVLGNKAAPFINRLADEYAVAAGYHDTFVHPSEANYLWMAAGQNFGILDNDDPILNHIASTSHIADQIEAAGLSWKTYQEGMGEPCGLVSHGRYAAKHNPFVFFEDINGWDGTGFQPSQRCIDHVVDYSQLDVDIAKQALPRYVFITPDLDNDMHDGSVARGDAWLSREIPKLMETDAYKKGGVIFLLWDEGGGSPPSDDPPFIAISPNAKRGYVSDTDFDTSSYLLTVQTLLGLEPLPCAEDATTSSAMEELFAVAMSPGDR